MKTLVLRPIAFATTSLALLLALPLAAQDIGVVASSEPTLRGAPPGASVRALNIGASLVSSEVVTSSASGRGQLLFLDQSTLSLAPNTTIVLDRFVFDPASGTGDMGLRLTEGALRFIGGRISRDTDATITTPSATIGIRGSSAFIVHLDGRTIAVFIAGERMCILTEAGAQTCTSRRGGVLTEDGYEGEVNPAFLQQIIALIDGAPQGGTGSNGGGGGTGIDNSALSDRSELSTLGEEQDDTIFADFFDLGGLLEIFPSTEDPVFEEGEAGGDCSNIDVVGNPSGPGVEGGGCD